MIEDIADSEPFAPFARWLALAVQSEELAETMTLATATPAGVPSLRAVLLKAVDGGGLVFYTNLESRKAGELFVNPHAALCVHWKSLKRQVRVALARVLFIMNCTEGAEKCGTVELATNDSAVVEAR